MKLETINKQLKEISNGFTDVIEVTNEYPLDVHKQKLYLTHLNLIFNSELEQLFKKFKIRHFQANSDNIFEIVFSIRRLYK